MKTLDPFCCDKALAYLQELPNDQHADPGYRHIRIEVSVRGVIIYDRVRFCPWCGERFVLRDPMSHVGEFHNVETWLKASAAGAQIPTAGGGPPPPRSTINGLGGFWVPGILRREYTVYVFVPDQIAAADSSGAYLPGQSSP
jgi:hypothetical protein